MTAGDSKGERRGEAVVAHVSADNALPLNATSPFSQLISRQIFQEGEIIELAVRPSAWWIIFRSWQTLLFAAVVALAGVTFDESVLPGRRSTYVELGLMLGLARLMWATVKWMSCIYVLTNMRVITITGVFSVMVIECPLRRLARVRATTPVRERIVLLGTLELIPMDEHFAINVWQTIRHPDDVQRKIRAAISRANQGTPPVAE